MSLATTGFPHAIASASMFDDPSEREGSTTISHAA
jgi:hypothetical protein